LHVAGSDIPGFEIAQAKGSPFNRCFKSHAPQQISLWKSARPLQQLTHALMRWQIGSLALR
jgi:hypothetical protein